MLAKTLMVQGTSSSVGKSFLVAALCRIFAQKGLRVAPFKAQNMSNNAAVCADGSEIGRAQAVQARAAGIEPTADMNPILLKPEANARSQVIVQGKPWKTLQAGGFYRRRDELWPIVTSALDRLRRSYDLIVIEGAGSPVELNLRDYDLVNMALALHYRAPVVLAGDIDRGGIFAQLLGTLSLFTESERALVGGLIVNKFRGDRKLFVDGVRILEERGGVPVLGVIPFLPALELPEEDSVGLEERQAARWDIAVIRFPCIANFDDFDQLRGEYGVHLRYVQSANSLGHPSAVVLPGTKSTMADLAWLRLQGLFEAIEHLALRGTPVVGICGGYQMLGQRIQDPDRVESSILEMTGLGLLPIETVFTPDKATHRVKARVRSGPGWLAGCAGQELDGYEIHCGRTKGTSPWLEILRQDGLAAAVDDGACSPEGRVWGCYLHGLFANDAFRRAWLDSLERTSEPAQRTDDGAISSRLDRSIDRLASTVATEIDMERLEVIIGNGASRPRPENCPIRSALLP